MTYKCFDPELGRKIAEELLKIKAIKLQPEKPFTWASGWKSPIYCDNRLSLSFPKLRNKIKDALCELVRVEFPDVEGIAAVATAGIPQGTLIADQLGVPLLYVRSKSKGHGLTNQIEGKIKKGQKVVVIEDLVSTGGSSLAAVEALRKSSVEVLGMASIFTYGFPLSKFNFEKLNVDLIYLSEYSLLLSAAISNGNLKPEMMETLNKWRDNPEEWGV